MFIVGNIFYVFKTPFQGKSCDTYVSPFDVHFWKKGINKPDVLHLDVFIACDTEEKSIREIGIWVCQQL